MLKKIKLAVILFLFVGILYALFNSPERKHEIAYGKVFIKTYLQKDMYLNSKNYNGNLLSEDKWSYIQKDNSSVKYRRQTYTVSFDNFKSCSQYMKKEILDYYIEKRKDEKQEINRQFYCVNQSDAVEFSFFKELSKLNRDKEKMFMKDKM